MSPAKEVWTREGNKKKIKKRKKKERKTDRDVRAEKTGRSIRWVRACQVRKSLPKRKEENAERR